MFTLVRVPAVSSFQSTCAHVCHNSVCVRLYMPNDLSRWWPDKPTPPCARRGPGRGTPRQHLPPSRVGGADRPKGWESRRTRARGCRTGGCHLPQEEMPLPRGPGVQQKVLGLGFVPLTFWAAALWKSFILQGVGATWAARGVWWVAC